jgi:phosphoribosyl 1,2-cyclic phosphodiesterase
MKVSFWGVRGSYPVPGKATNRYGGNTSCVQIMPDDETIIIIDAGTGIRKLGQHLMDGPCGRGRGVVHLLISHTHWDHIQGLPFFAPLHKAGNTIRIYSRQHDDMHLHHIFEAVTDDPYFPIPFSELKSKLEFIDLVEGNSFEIGTTKVRCTRLNHPSVAMGYRLENRNTAVAYVSDTAPFRDLLMEHEFIPAPPDPADSLPPEDAALLAQMRQGVVDMCRGVDLAIYDTHFTEEEYGLRPHWGHSAPEHALEILHEARAHALALFHHAPQHDDDTMDAIVADTQKRAGEALVVIGAKEGMKLALPLNRA